MNFNINDDDDDFAPNPFRSDRGSNDLLGAAHPQPLQPDPYSGMTGTLEPSSSPPRQSMPASSSSPAADPALWSGTMDQRGPSVENYGANALPNGQQPSSQASTPFNLFSWRSWVACCRIDAYTQYFDVDTVDITERLKASLLKFHQPDQFRTAVVGDIPTENLKGPDLYGPVWIAMTFVFVLAATSNIYGFWEHHKSKRAAGEGEVVKEFEVDINHLLHACNVVFFFVFGVSSTFWLAASCMNMSGIPWGLWVCVYGYSQVPFVVACILLCIFPLHLLTWSLLFVAYIASTSLVVRNLSTPLISQDTTGQKKSAPLIMAILLVHFIYFLVIKFTFYHQKF